LTSVLEGFPRFEDCVGSEDLKVSLFSWFEMIKQGLDSFSYMVSFGGGQDFSSVSGRLLISVLRSRKKCKVGANIEFERR
jgi:hypothetical protein